MKLGFTPIVRAAESRGYDDAGRLQSVRMAPVIGTSTGPDVLGYHYQFDSQNRRKTAYREDSRRHWDYGYDAKGQVVSAEQRLQNGERRAGWQADYQYDGIGNRTVMHYGGNSVGGQRRTVSYGADAQNLNRYSSITFGDTTDVADVTGLADSQTAAQTLRLNLNGAGYTTAPSQVQGGYYDFKIGSPSYAFGNKGSKLAFNLGKSNPYYPGYYDSLDSGKLVLPPVSADAHV